MIGFPDLSLSHTRAGGRSLIRSPTVLLVPIVTSAFLMEYLASCKPLVFLMEVGREAAACDQTFIFFSPFKDYPVNTHLSWLLDLNEIFISVRCV